MTKLNVPGMNCGHCKSAIEAAIGSLDQAARVNIDLSSKIVTVQSDAADQAIVAALKSKGYDATVLA